MIARLSSEVFYIITRKLLGAFYVDQKKKDLPPSTLPSEHKQWVLFYGPNKNTALPVAVSKKFAEFATHCGTATSINAIPDFANSFHSLTKIGFNSSDGDDGSIFLMISLGQV